MKTVQSSAVRQKDRDASRLFLLGSRVLVAEEAAAMLLGPARKHFMMSRAVAFIKTFLLAVVLRASFLTVHPIQSQNSIPAGLPQGSARTPM